MQRQSTCMTVTLACLLLGLSACGGEGGDEESGGPPPPPPPPPAGTIGASGGTVSGPNGARIEIPAGALATNTVISIEQTSANAPALPTGFTASGQTFAFLPHGTTFAVPVTVTLPFDAVSVPAGTVPGLYKTNAQNQWEPIANATVSAGTVTAQITSFSFGTTGVERRAAQRQWLFSLVSGLEIPGNDFSSLPWLEVHPIEPFPANVIQLDNDDTTTLEVFSSADGVTFWTSAEDVGKAELLQTQGFIKRAPNATLQFEITAGLLEAMDLNEVPTPGECPEGIDRVETCSPIRAAIEFSARAVDAAFDPLLDRNGGHALDAMGDAVLQGRTGLWEFDGSPYAYDTTVHQVWTNANFAVAGTSANHARASLLLPIVLDVDLSNVGLNQKFYVESFVSATAINGRLREASVRALVRDPARIGGTAVRSTGLELTGSVPLIPPRPPAPPVPCTTGPNPAAGVLQFSAPNYTALEAFLGRAEIVVTRTQGSTGAVSATLTTGGGSATPGVHYQPLTLTVFFGDGDTAPRTLRLDLLDNSTAESDQTVRVALSEPGGCATLGAQSSAALTILDDDTPPTLPTQFTVGGTVFGLIGDGLVLDNNGGIFLAIPANGPFTFTTLPAPSGSPYNVRVFNHPHTPPQNCTVTNGSGVFTDHNVTNVEVRCVGP
jgi:hypothetical protein